MNVSNDVSLLCAVKRLICSAMLIGAGLGSVEAQTGAAAPDSALTQELISVRTLMRLEMAMALDRARQQAERLNKTNRHNEGRGPARLELPASALRLMSLYGTGSKLVAQVQAGTRTLTYINGQPWPVGVTSGKTVYRLVSMKGRCLTLVRQETVERVCMESGSGEAP